MVRGSSHLPGPLPLLALFRSVVSPPCPWLLPWAPRFLLTQQPEASFKARRATSLFRSLMALHPMSPCLLEWHGLGPPHCTSLSLSDLICKVD